MITWKSFLSNKKNLIEFIITMIVLIAVLISFSQFLNFIEQREGVVLSDPILNAFNPVDLTWLNLCVNIFILISIYCNND